MLGDNAVSTQEFSSMYFFFPMDEAGIKKDFGSASGEQYRHANTEPCVALSSENSLGSQWSCSCASRRETLCSQKCIRTTFAWGS